MKTTGVFGPRGNDRPNSASPKLRPQACFGDTCDLREEVIFAVVLRYEFVNNRIIFHLIHPESGNQLMTCL
jgi:hypothetical protein